MAKIKITIIRLSTGQREVYPLLQLEVDDEHKVERIKQMIRSNKGFPVPQQLLVHYKQVLDNSKTLKSYGIGEGSKILLITQSRGALQISYQLGKKAGFLRVWEGETISQVNAKIFEKENVAVNTVSLSRTDNGVKRLDDSETVASAGITLDAIITCT